MSSQQYLQHILSRLHADLEFLQTTNALSFTAHQSIKAQLATISLPAGGSTGLESQVANLGFGSNGNAVAGASVPSPSPSAHSNVAPLQTCRAVWDYHGNQPDDLSFAKDDVIVINEEMNADWFRGNLNGRTGIFPSNHIEKIAPEPAAPSYAASVHQANTPYHAQPSFIPSAQPSYAYQQPQHYAPSEKQNYIPPAPPTVAAAPEVPPKKKRFGQGTMGNTLAHAGVGGLGFGAGSAAASSVINAIF